MAGSNFSDLLKNSVTEKVFATLSSSNANGKHEDRTIFGVKLNPEEFEKVTAAIAGAASAIGPIIAKSREKTAEVVQNAPTRETFEEKFSAAIETIDKRGAEARDRMKISAANAKDATTQAADKAREATTHAAANAREATSQAAASAKEATTHAASETADAGKNLLGFFFWLAAAGAAVYYLILDEERREQVIDVAKRSKNIASGIVSEIRGEDGVFRG